jgi:tetrapyrrole methylase family protein/MazG family protein
MKRSSEALAKYFNSVQQMFRGDKACPWLKTQSHESLLPYLKEEIGEFISALRKFHQSSPSKALSSSKLASEVIGELGDLWLQSVLHLLLVSESAGLPVDAVIEQWTKKVVDRHPHVFDEKLSLRSWSREEVLLEWRKRKKLEKDQASENSGLAPKTADFLEYSGCLSELVRAHKIGERSRQHNFDWENPREVVDKVSEELQELKEELKTGTDQKSALSEELGDLLFSTVQLARHLGISAEESLARANDKFISRFEQVERQLTEEDPAAAAQSWLSIPRDRLEAHWKKAKAVLRAAKATKT